MPSSAEYLVKLWNRKLHYSSDCTSSSSSGCSPSPACCSITARGSSPSSGRTGECRPTAPDRAAQRRRPRRAGEGPASAARHPRRDPVGNGNPGSARVPGRSGGQNLAVKADLVQRIAKVEQTDVNAWGVMRVLHTFTGRARRRSGQPPRLGGDHRVGALDGRRGDWADRDGVERSLYVVGLGRQAATRAAARFCREPRRAGGFCSG